jgi:hypothetical protein
VESFFLYVEQKPQRRRPLCVNVTNFFRVTPGCFAGISSPCELVSAFLSQISFHSSPAHLSHYFCERER